MPLIKVTLEQALKAGIEAELTLEFKKPDIKKSLRTYLDGGSATGGLSTAKSIDKALSNIKTATSAIDFGKADNPASQAVSSALVKKVTANEWSNAISDSVAEWLSSDISKIIAKVIAKNVADQVDTYIKSATIIVPPGITIAGGGGGPAPVTGATIAPSAPATIT
jgi:hypothetical protein